MATKVPAPSGQDAQAAASMRRLKALYELSMKLSGDPMVVFERIARMIGELLDVRIVCLSEIRGDELHFRSVYVGGDVVMDAGRCPLAITPCATVEQTKDLRVYDRVQERFPQATFLKQHDAFAYCGFPSLDSDGNVVAVTCLLDAKPHDFTPEDQELLHAFGQRIGMEVEHEKHLERGKQAEAALRASEARLAGILDIAPDAVVSIDEGGRIQLFNQRAEDVFGYSANEVLGRPLEALLPARFREAHRRQIETFGAAAEVSRAMGRRPRIVGLRKDGTEFPVEASISRLDLAGGAIFTAILQDVSERRAAEAAMRTAMQEATLANRAKSQFLANMSHELRTPLNAIIGFSELIKNEAFGPVGTGPYRDYARDIHESGLHLLEIINDILDLSKIESRKDELKDDDVSIPEVAVSAVSMLWDRAQSGGVALELDLADDLPTLRADERKLKQILINLLSNAVKFTLEGGSAVLKVWAHGQSGLVFQVVDTGIGIALDDIPRALAPFEQVDGTVARKFEGTGLGLPIAKALVEQHGGSLDLQSAVGVGTTVTVRFPRERMCSPRGAPSAIGEAKAAG